MNTEVLFLGDSHMKSLIVEELENKLRGNITHGILPGNSFTTSGGHPLGAYNSSFNWPNAYYPRGSQELWVPEILSQNNFDFLIIF